jgi:post-segregation antitoxin (ccd killing protein)
MLIKVDVPVVMRIMFCSAHKGDAMARINVSVPDSLKERMSALDSRVNWSEVAQAAFEREIVNHTTFEVEDMEQVIERLRVSKKEYATTQNAKGKKDGHDWACRYATYADLRAVSDLEPQGTEFAAQVDAALGKNPREGDSFWINEDTGQVKYPSDDYVFGFWDAADDVFAEIKDKL